MFNKNEISNNTDVMVNPAIASRWLAEHSYPLQRNIKRAFSAFLISEMRKGRFQQGTQLWFARTLDGKLYLVDGQHRLTAISKTENEKHLFSIRVVDVKNYSAVADVYTRLDQGVKRTAADAFSAHELPAEIGITSTAMNRLAAAVKLVEGKFRLSRRLSPYDLMVWVKKYGNAYYNFIEDTRGRDDLMTKAMNSATCTAIAVITYQYCDEKAAAFWGGVFDDSGLEKGDPRKTLGRWLLSHPYRNFANNVRGTGQGIRQHYALYLMRAWNAYYEGRELVALQVRNPADPIVLSGTGYNTSKENSEIVEG